jgi:hypothetical protein
MFRSRHLLSLGLSTILVFSLALSLIPPPPAGAANTGMAWLAAKPDTRAAILGNAVVSNVSDASASIWNPAGLAAMVGGEGLISHAESFADLRREFAALARNYGSFALGAHFEGVWTENLDGYDESGNFQGTFGYYGLAAGLAGAVPLGDNLRIGAGGKYIREAIDVHSAGGWAVDLGAQWAFDELPLVAGVSVLNLGPRVSFINEEFSLPTIIQGGASYVVGLPSLSGGILVSGEYRKPRDRDSSFLVGVEYQHLGLVSLGFGYRSGMDEQDISLGFGFRRDRFRVHYAFVPFTESLIGDEHRLGLGVRIW